MPTDRFPIEPLEDRVVVLPDDSEGKTPGGILLPDTAKEKPTKGTVIATGPGKFMEDGKTRYPMPVQVGDRVLFSRWTGHEFTDGGKEYRICSADDLKAKLVEGKSPAPVPG
jgi:chaperonin GroES